ncbi:MAG: hypothetical protein ABIN89_17210 [Chitinophagaceae bacterium]
MTPHLRVDLWHSSIKSAFAGAVTKFTQLTWLRRSIQIVSGLALLFV